MGVSLLDYLAGIHELAVRILHKPGRDCVSIQVDVSLVN